MINDPYGEIFLWLYGFGWAVVLVVMVVTVEPWRELRRRTKRWRCVECGRPAPITPGYDAACDRCVYRLTEEDDPLKS